MDTVELHAPPAAAPPISAKAAMLSPVLAALCYPFLLRAFHAAVVSSVDQASAAVTPLAVACLLGALATPLLGLAVAFRLSRDDRPSRFVLRARRLAYASIATPPMFVFAGVALGLLHSSIRDTSAWVAGWLATLAYGWSARDSEVPASASTVARLRVAHGVSAVLLAAFVLFHLSNHLTGLLGPAAHARVMEIGRTVYRSTWSEPVFIAFLLFQGRERASPRLALERAPRRPLSHRPGRIRRVSRGLHRHPPELGADLRAHGPRRRDGLGLGLRRAGRPHPRRLEHPAAAPLHLRRLLRPGASGDRAAARPSSPTA